MAAAVCDLDHMAPVGRRQKELQGRHGEVRQKANRETGGNVPSSSDIRGFWRVVGFACVWLMRALLDSLRQGIVGAISGAVTAWLAWRLFGKG